MSLKKVYLTQFSIIAEDQFLLLPYSVGLLWSYAKTIPEILHNYNLEEILFVKRPINEMMKTIIDPDVVGFSTYIWNNNYCDQLAKTIKEQYPECLIVYGGPQVPDKDDELFIKKPWIDICVHQEGELAFSEILLQNLDQKDWGSIPGLSYNCDTKRIQTPPSQRIKDLNSIPSPYLSGVFDDCFGKYPQYTLNAIIESNRGCPFKCTFCDWGSATFSKVNKFDMSRMKEEIQWMAEKNIDCVVNADANFGILKDRDSQIVDILVETKKKYGYPRLFTTNWNKNNNELAVEMAKRLKDSGLLRKFAISLQSLNPKVLVAIKRNNMKLNDFEYLIKLADQYGITVMIELIMCLPEETYDSWTKNYCDLLKHDNLFIESYPLTMLPNSETSSEEYRKEFGLQTCRVKFPFSDYVDEYEDVVIETSSMSRAESFDAWMFTWVVRSMHIYGFLFYVCKYIVKKYEVTHYDFYKKIQNGMMESHGIAHEVYARQYAFIKDSMFVDFYYLYDWIKIVGEDHREEFYNEMKQIVSESFDDCFLDEIFQFQNIACYSPHEKYPQELDFNYNVIDDIPESCTVKFEHDGMSNFNEYKSFIGLSRSSGWKTKVSLVQSV